jgi:hypothetical protein
MSQRFGDDGARRRFQGDDGSVIVQVALTVPLVLFLFLGIFEYGMVFRDYLTLTDGALDASRVGAIMGPKVDANRSGDEVMLETLRNDLGAIPASTISKVVIFKGQPLGQGDALSQVPSTCRNGSSSSASASCNVYDATTAFAKLAPTPDHNYFKCTVPASSPPPCGWPPTSRQDGTGTTVINPTIDYVGVYIKLNRPFVSKLFGNTFTLETAAVQRLEPGFLDQ